MKGKRTSSHVQVSLLILCAVVLMLSASALTVSHHCDRLHTLITQIVAADATDDAEQTLAAIHTLQQEWQESCFWLKLFLPRQSISELNTGIARLQPLAEAGNDELVSECAVLLAIVEWLDDQL